MRRFTILNPAMIVAFIALLIALGGTALAATGQIVNITDPSDSSHKATVSADGSLQVGDASGPLTVDGAVATTSLAQSHLVRIVGGATGNSCTKIASPPAGKAWILTSMLLNVYKGSQFFDGDVIEIWDDTACHGSLIAELSPTHRGTMQVDLGEGVPVPDGHGVSISVSTGALIGYRFFAYGHQGTVG
jgi:hypothetical protein